MPVISLPLHDLLGLLGKEMSPAELADAIVSMGAEDKGAHEGVLDIEFFPNRPDLYSVEGGARPPDVPGVAATEAVNPRRGRG